VQKLPQISSSIIKLSLPNKNYGPFCNKILTDFIEFHNLPKDLELPSPGLSTSQSLSRIFDVLLHSMGEKKRQEALELIKEYKSGLPVDYRD
jgi:hypothetical protein